MTENVEILINDALAALREERYDDAWEFIRALHLRGGRNAFQRCEALSECGDEIERRLAAGVLGQLGCRPADPNESRRPFLAESLPILIRLANDSVDEVVFEAVQSLGHLGDDGGRAAVLAHTKHHDADIRCAVAISLASLTPVEASINALMDLTRDPDNEVRDWATFGLGSQIEEDTENIRKALFDRLSDDDLDVRSEAVAGLAIRKDRSVLPVLVAELERDEPYSFAFEAAEELGAVELIPVLTSYLTRCEDYKRAERALISCLNAKNGTMIIAIDGPAAAGKGTLARLVAERYGLAFLDTGSLYRGVAWAVLEGGGDPADDDAAGAAARAFRVEDIEGADIRTAAVGAAASVVAAKPAVRAALLDYQRRFAAAPPGGAKGAVLDGRDVGTVVCPEADVKLFVTASAEARAKRRFAELKDKNPDLTEAALLEDLKARDARDAGRADAPMTPAADAVLIDTTEMSIEAAFAAARRAIDQRLRQG